MIGYGYGYGVRQGALLNYEPEIKIFTENLTEPISTSEKIILNDFVKDLKTGWGVESLSDAIDLMVLMDSETQEASLKNIVKDAHHGTPVNNPTWEAGVGFTGNGSSMYLDFDYTPSVDADNFKQNDGSMGVYVASETTGGGTMMGQRSSAAYSYIEISDDITFAYLNVPGSGYIAKGGYSSAKGLHLVSRNGNLMSDLILYKDSDATIEPIIYSELETSGVSPFKLTVLARRRSSINVDSYSSGTASFIIVAKHITPAMNTVLYNALMDYYEKKKGIDIMIPALDTAVDNYVMRIALHSGEQRGDERFDELFFRGNSRTDFKDVRFVDENDNELDWTIHSSGNYDIIRDSNLPQVIGHLSTGEIIGHDPNVAGISRSNDNCATWTLIDATLYLTYIDSNDNIYGRIDNALYRLTPADDYATKQLVLTVLPVESRIAEWRGMTEDSDGNLYAAKYQTEWDIEIFKSIDGGVNWTSIYQTDTSQHVHNLYVDKNVTPNAIYAGLDGDRKTIKSTDGGATWTDVNIPYPNSDYGLTFAGDGYRLGHGEAEINGGPTIYRTTDDENYYPVLKNQQGVRAVSRLGNLIVAGGNASSVNKVAQVFVSSDEGLTWKTAFATNWYETASSGDGPRYLTDAFTPMGSEEEQMFITGRYYGREDYVEPNLRMYAGGNNHYALAYVKVGSLPAEGRKITAKFGNSLYTPKEPFYDIDYPSNLLLRVRFDEGEGFTALEQVSETNIALPVGSTWATGKTVRYSSIVPFHHPEKCSGILLPSAGNIKLSDNLILPSKNFTITFWANYYNGLDYTERFVIGNPDGLRISLYDYSIVVTNGTGNYKKVSVFSRTHKTDLWHFYSLTVSNDALPVITASAGHEIKTPVAFESYPEPASGPTYFLGSPEVAAPHVPIADFRLYDTVLTKQQIREIYLGHQYLADV